MSRGLSFVWCSTLAVVAGVAPVMAQAPAAPSPAAVHISPAEVSALLESAIAKGLVDQPIKGVDVHGGRS